MNVWWLFWVSSYADGCSLLMDRCASKRLSKDVILQLNTSIASAGTFYTDGSGMELMKRTVGRSKSPLATENLLENTAGVLRPHQCSLGVAACYLLFMRRRGLY